MALSADVTLNNGTTTTVVSEISRTGNETLRRAASRGLIYPKTLRISHQSVKAGKSGVANRFVVRLDDVQSVSVDDPLVKAMDSVYLVVQRPEILTDSATVLALVEELKTFLTAANLAKLLNGES